jgi:hypothetical protein
VGVLNVERSRYVVYGRPKKFSLFDIRKTRKQEYFPNKIFIKVNAKTKDEDFPLNKNHHQDNLTKFVFDPEMITISHYPIKKKSLNGPIKLCFGTI